MTDSEIVDAVYKLLRERTTAMGEAIESGRIEQQRVINSVFALGVKRVIDKRERKGYKRIFK